MNIRMLKVAIGLISGWAVLGLPTAAYPRNSEPILSTRVPVLPFVSQAHQERQLMARNFYSQCSNSPTSYRFCRNWLREVYEHFDQWGNGFYGDTLETLPERLAFLNRIVQQRLESYDIQSYQWQNRTVGRLGMTVNELNWRTNRRFRCLFPEREGRAIIPTERLTGQIWLAVRDDELMQMGRIARVSLTKSTNRRPCSFIYP